jgi:hypothetical protein
MRGQQIERMINKNNGITFKIDIGHDHEEEVSISFKKPTKSCTI